MISNIVISLVFLYYIWPFQLKILGDAGFIIMYDIIPLLYIFLNHHYLYKLLRDKNSINVILRICFIFMLLFIYSVLNIEINNGENSYILELLRVVQRIIVYVFLMIVTIKRSINNSEDYLMSFMKMYVISCCLYIISTIVFLAYPDFRNIWMDVIYQSDAAFDMSQEIRRQTRFGLKGFTNFGEVTVCSFAVIMSNYIIHSTNKIYSRWTAALYLLLLGCAFYGRSGLILAVIMTCIYSLIFISKVEVKRLFVHTLVIVLVVMGLIYIAEFDERFAYLLMWIADPIVSFVDSAKYGQFSIGSSGNILVENMWFVPQIETIFLGDGRYMNPDGSYYMYTDAGFLRHILFGGIPALVIGYFLIILLYWKSLKRKRGVLNYNVAITMIVISIFVQELKGVVYFFHIGLLFVLYSLGYLWDTRKRIYE